MKALSFDLGAKTGWAYFNNSGYAKSGVLRVTSQRKGFCRWDAWLCAVEGILEATPREGLVIAYEEVRRHVGTDAAHAWGGYRALLEFACHRIAIEPRPCGVSAVKKWSTGSGAARKPQMIAAAKVFSGKEITDDNEADAVCIAAFARSR